MRRLASPRATFTFRACAGVFAAGILAALVVLVAAGGSILDRPTEGSDPFQRVGGDHPVGDLGARCRAAMLQQTCRAMAASPGASAADPNGQLFIAGVGVVPAAWLGELRAAGDAMCEQVERHCQDDPRGPRCRASRALFPANSAAAP